MLRDQVEGGNLLPTINEGRVFHGEFPHKEIAVVVENDLYVWMRVIPKMVVDLLEVLWLAVPNPVIEAEVDKHDVPCFTLRIMGVQLITGLRNVGFKFFEKGFVQSNTPLASHKFTGTWMSGAKFIV